MKQKPNPFRLRTIIASGAIMALPLVSYAQTYNWNTTTSTWDTTSSNWSGSGSVWVNDATAIFANTASASTITLSDGLTASSVLVGNGSNNANYTFTGGSLSATSFIVQGNSGQLSENAVTTISNSNISLSGSLGVGRGTLIIGGTSQVSASSIISPTTGDGPGAWGVLTIQDTATVTATNGFSISTTAWGLNLNGGTLITSGIQYSPHTFNGSTNLNFNGSLIRANQNNASFITYGVGGNDNASTPNIQSGGARFDTNGFNIGIGIAMTGVGGLTKSGDGVLTLGVANSYTGGTTINGGTLQLSHEPGGIANTAIGAMSSSNTVTINNGGILTGTVNNWLSSTSLASGGSNAISVTVNQGGTLRGAAGRITGLGNVNLNGGTIEVTNGLGSFGWNSSFTLGGDITVGGSAASYITTASGSGATANIDLSNGNNGIGGTRTITVNDVTTGSDLILSARIANGTIIKAGAGTMELATGATGTGASVNWTVNGGTLFLNRARDANSVGAGASLIINAGATVKLGNTGQIDDGLTSFTIDGGTFDLDAHVEGFNPAVSLNNGTITGTSAGFILARGGYTGTGTNTISQRVSSRSSDANSGLFNITSGTTTVSGQIFNDFGGAAGITKRGGGTLTLTGTNSYGGDTIVEAGTLVVNGTIANATTTTVQSGATIGGNGSVGNLTIQSGASINPGNSPGTLTVNGDYSQAGTLVAEINGLTAGTQHDQVVVNGSVNLTGSLTVLFGGATTYNAGDMIFLLVNDSTDTITGAFSNFAQGDFVQSYGGFDWIISYTANSGATPTFTGGNDIALLAVPEPSVALLGGLCVLGLLRRRRN